MLQIINISKYYGAETVLEDVSFVVSPGDRVALVGPNGCGKSTLLHIITGQEKPDRGHISLDTHASLGYLPQGIEAARGRSVAQEVRAGVQRLEHMRQQVEVLSQQMAAAQGDTQTELLTQYGEALTEFEALGGYDVEHRIEMVLAGLGLAAIAPDTPMTTLSGGQQTRVGLARLLIGQPNVLLLDEPTNHLDIEALEWLEGFLASYEGAALIVSHDRTFLDNTVNRIVEIDPGTHQAKTYAGNYSEYKAAKAQEIDKQWVEWKDQRVEIRRLKADIQRTKEQAMSTERATTDSSARRLSAKVAKKAITRQSRLERYIDSEERVEKPEQSWQMKLEFGEMPRGGTVVATLKDLAHSFDGERWLFQDLNQTILHGERIAFLGPNGTGKSTLLRALVGELAPKQGEIRLGANIQVGYMPQKQETLHPTATPLSLVRHSAAMSETEARNFLHFFLFAGDDVFTPIAKLSYGERARLLLARLVVQGANFLVLDEPINHLDIPSRQRFEEALEAYPGTVLAAVHDRAFIENFADKIWELRDGKVNVVY
ncbi:MAG: ABC-F family ATP-binding cassette domain-containing protein [Anaerolineales bacterium]|nr:ABC-F family ATP-binding cassette domain-containing protein [Anaerolineales bacterium]